MKHKSLANTTVCSECLPGSFSNILGSSPVSPRNQQPASYKECSPPNTLEKSLRLFFFRTAFAARVRSRTEHDGPRRCTARYLVDVVISMPSSRDAQAIQRLPPAFRSEAARSHRFGRLPGLGLVSAQPGGRMASRRRCLLCKRHGIDGEYLDSTRSCSVSFFLRLGRYTIVERSPCATVTG